MNALARPQEAVSDDPLARVEREIATTAAALAVQAPEALRPVAKTVAAFVTHPGRRVRARLCLAAEELVRPGVVASQGAVRLAAAIEVVHAFMLAHDDLMDCADVRRGRPSLHVALRHAGRLHAARTGNDLALVAGDWIYTQGIRLALAAPLPAHARVRVVETLLEVFAETARGQALDAVLGEAALGDVRAEDVLEVSRAKTARYTFEAPLVAGALAAGAGEHVIAALRAFARDAGTAFQLADDMLGLYAPESETGKPATSDLVEGKKTWPIVRAFSRAGTADRAWLAERLDARDATHADLLRVRELVRSTGALADALALLDDFSNSALQHLATLPPGAPRRRIQTLFERSLEPARLHARQPLAIASLVVS